MVATETAKPFAGTPISSALEFRKRNRPAVHDLVDAAYGATSLQVTAVGGDSINIADGRAIVQGAYYELTGGPYNLAVGANGTGSNRTDYAVLTYDDSHAPGVYARVLEGTALTQNDTGIWDMPLASWQKTPAGAIINLLDLRPWRGTDIRPCTSTTRPRNPTLGQIAYEADTDRIIKWNGTVWDGVHQDTGWVSLALNGPDGHAWTPNVVSRIRKINRTVHMRTSIKRDNNLDLPTTDDGSRVFLIPAGFRPEVSEVIPGFHGRSPLMWQIDPSGEATVYPLINQIPGGRTITASGQWLVD